MKSIAYVGNKPEETAFFHDTGGIVWVPDAVHPVADHIAARMLEHPDVFALAKESDGPGLGKTKAAADTKPPEDKVPGPVSTITVDGSVVNLDALEQPELHALAKELKVKVHPQAGAVKVRAALLTAFPTAPV